MRLDDDQSARMRRSAQALLDGILPYREGDAAYREVCKDYSGSGTTCGFLCHWLMWRLGVTNVDRVNRGENGFRYRDGKNITRIVYGEGKPDASGWTPFVRAHGSPAMSLGARPDVGDIIYIAETPTVPQTSEHVFCVLRTPKEGQTWHTAESGQEHGRWGKKRNDRELRFGGSINPLLTGNSPTRSIIGWLALDQLDYGPPPKPLPVPYPVRPPALRVARHVHAGGRPMRQAWAAVVAAALRRGRVVAFAAASSTVRDTAPAA